MKAPAQADDSGGLIAKARAVNARALALNAAKIALDAELNATKTAFHAAVARLEGEIHRSHALAFEFQAREAATRANLTEAIIGAMRSRCAARERARAALFGLYFPQPRPPWRGRGLLFRLLDRAGLLRRRLPPLFDAAFYAGRHRQELVSARLGPAAHYMAVGQARGLDPHPLFDMGHYAAQAPQPRRGEHLAAHYLREGWRLGLSPHPLFDPTWYGDQAGPDAANTPPLLHYLERGWREGLSPHPLFDPTWYVAANPDVAASAVEPLSHFLTHGAAEGRAPNPWFDVPFYLGARGEPLQAGHNPLVDYLEGGGWRVAAPMPGFATGAYVAAHPEVASEDMTPLEHWVRRSRPASDESSVENDVA